MKTMETKIKQMNKSMKTNTQSMYVCIVFGRHWVCIIIRVSV